MLRPLDRSDLPALTRILRETGAFTEGEVDCALELLNIVLDDPRQLDYLVTVAEDERRVAGYILYGPVPLTEGVLDIYWIATDPTVQGKGFGRQLMLHAEKEARRRGAQG
ncbi:MAG TPA: GNAT family N-acetyltransferase [Desulfuromonadales bacterium]|nr:GNAT family N-acetyltransferase [Desulfuromonadales bacterium]